MTGRISSQPKRDKIKDCHVGQKYGINIHEPGIASGGDSEIDQEIQDQQGNQEKLWVMMKKYLTFQEDLRGRDVHQTDMML
ncbi:hypothetical protein JTB14_017886 [Gonioctena quinquepunctata]|nr:hypothetical protein JTB14_017886 [Gonioctena quinquepunctata]